MLGLGLEHREAEGQVLCKPRRPCGRAALDPARCRLPWANAILYLPRAGAGERHQEWLLSLWCQVEGAVLQSREIRQAVLSIYYPS